MQFEMENPELKIPGPDQFEMGPLDTMRKMAILYLGKAFGVEGMDDSLPKKDLMPLMQSAETRGVFKGTPVKPWLLARVQYPENPEKWPEAPQKGSAGPSEAAPDEKAGLPPVPKVPVPLEDMNFKEIRVVGREAGINTFQMNWRQIYDAIKALETSVSDAGKV